MNRIMDWFAVEPDISLLMVITAVVLFGSAYSRIEALSPAFWHWIRRIIEASVVAVLFIGLLWAFRSILTNNYNSFLSTHGSASNVSLLSAQSIWGRPHRQVDLGYTYFREVIVQEELPREDPSDPPLYRDVRREEVVPQNSIMGFRGTVNLTLSEREKGYALYNGYIIDATFVYDVMNDSVFTTWAWFDFALSPGQTLFEDFMITVDGEDISRQLRFSNDIVSWRSDFHPAQERQIVISYRSRGMGSFYYQIPSQRAIKNFELVLTVDRLPVSLVNYPDSTLAANDIQPTEDGQGTVLTWRLDKAITTAGMGVALPSPEQPGEQVRRVLDDSPIAVTLLVTMVALTLLLRGQPVNFIDLALLAGTYLVQFLLMASISDFVAGFWGALIVGAACTGVMTYLLFRKHTSSLLRNLIYGMVAFFAVIYPLLGLITDMSDRNSFDGLVRVGLIVYLFALALYTRVEKTRTSAA